MPKVLVSGKTGQLGRELQALVAGLPEETKERLNFVFMDRSTLDIAKMQWPEEIFQDVTHFINTAAYTAVDKAQSEVELAYKVNADGPELLAKICADRGIRMIHYSTDFVFDGKKHIPYKEDEDKRPLNVYGKTKSEGEKAILAKNPNTLIVRTSWVYAREGQNFVNTILRLAKERGKLNVIYDQVGSPTWAGDLAVFTMQVLERPETGIYHYSNEGVASWYDFACSICEYAGVPCEINPIEAKDYPLPAMRPHYSVLNKNKAKNTFGIGIPHWRDSLRRVLKNS